MALRLGLLLALLGCTAAPDPALEEAWEGWKSLHAKEYPGETEATRREVWEKNLRRIQQHNREESQGQHAFRLAMNHYGDLTDEEFDQLLNGFTPVRREKPAPLFQVSAALKTPVEVDWRAKGYVTPVKNQGHCGSCWAFSATGALEGLVFNRTGKLTVLSEQNLIDCSRKLGNNGCHGGYMTRAFQYVHDNGGLNSEHVYPYTAMVREGGRPWGHGRAVPAGPSPGVTLSPSSQDTSSCRYNPQDRAANCSAIWLVAQGSEAALEQAVATVGPVSVAVDASSFHFHFYKSGIFSSMFCSQQVNHGMLAVGYGTSQERGRNVSYWILKNSWSEAWGEQGYIRLLKGADNQCGVANQASFPVL
ncbi:procathepsin L-like isoform X2 [Aquila chrysaetos chrysaetos]|nr:procathepsin L-like isoform X2 [Aquila chrysaetos chrysaetos]XP_040983548.1 procathepsin L-like isoform X2 [Aquila chrysaetos chrysaetos]XP_040983549.1 procathepsin L-like isoform X2 [Aquila chrysaetos chrysaetos]